MYTHLADQPATEDGRPSADFLDLNQYPGNLFRQMPTTGNAQGDSIARLGLRRTTNVTIFLPLSLVIPLPRLPGGIAAIPWGFLMGDAIPVNAAHGNTDLPEGSTADTNADNTQQGGPRPRSPSRPPIVADMLRVTVDMVFDGPPLRRPAQAPRISSPDAGNNQLHPQNATTSEQPGVETAVGTPNPVANTGRLEQFLNLVRGDRRTNNGPASNTNTNSPELLPADVADANVNQESPQIPAQPEAQRTGRVPSGFSLGGFRVASGSGRSIAEAFSRMFSNFQQRVHQAPGGQDRPNQPQSDPADGNDAPAPTPILQPQPNPPQEPQPQARLGHPWQFVPIPMDSAFPMRPPQPEGPKRPWVLPPAPGPTLRQRIERREREAGLRCHDISCGIGPSDDDLPGECMGDVVCNMRQLSIQCKEKDLEGARKAVCEHKFHSACLVSAERIALRGVDVVVDDEGCVEVSCPVCRGVGCVSKAEWDEGVRSLL